MNTLGKITTGVLISMALAAAVVGVLSDSRHPSLLQDPLDVRGDRR